MRNKINNIEKKKKKHVKKNNKIRCKCMKRKKREKDHSMEITPMF